MSTRWREFVVALAIIVATLAPRSAPAQPPHIQQEMTPELQAAIDEIPEEIREQVSLSMELFALFNWCQPMKIVVENLGDEATRLRLTKDRLRSAAESRLRAANLHEEGGDDGDGSYLYVRVGVSRRAFVLDLQYRKLVTDLASEQMFAAPTWDEQVFGTHGGDVLTVTALLSELLDDFMADYLRVNEIACSRLRQDP